MPFTTLTPSADSRLIYISSSTGNDSNSGLSASAPKATITGASGGLSLMRSGSPDWMMLKCGDTFSEASGIRWKIAGRSASERAVFTTYGTGARPIVVSTDTSALAKFNGSGTPNPCDHVAIVGIEFTVTGRTSGTTPSCISWQDPTTNLLIEDCCCHGGYTGITVQGVSGTITNVQIKRNILYRNYSTNTGHAQNGYFALISGLELVENFSDYGGYDPSASGNQAADGFKHSFYVNESCTGSFLARGNVIMRPSSHGLQARIGGTILNNVFIECPISLLSGGGDSPVVGGVTTTVANNLIHGDAQIAGSGRGYGIDLKNILLGTVTGNHVVNKTTSDGAFAIGSYVSGGSVGVGVTNCTVQRNRIYNWRGGLYFGTGSQTYTSVVIDSNHVETRLGDTPYLGYNGSGAWTGRTFTNNRYYSTAGGSCFYTGSAATYATWAAAAGESGSTFTTGASGITAPPNILTAMSALSGDVIASLDDLSELFTGRGRGEWNTNVSAERIYAYYAGGFSDDGGDDVTTYYVHPSGTGTTQAQCSNPLTPAASLNRLFSYVSAGTGFANGDIVAISGTITGTETNPEYGYASYNFGGSSVAVTFQPWGVEQQNPAGFTLTQPLLRGDAPLGALAWDATGYNKITLATGLLITGVTYRWGEIKTREGVPMAHLQYVSSSANVAANNNSWFYDSVTGVLYVRVTDANGTAITGSSIASGYIGIMLSQNALLELQNARGCVIRGLHTANTVGEAGVYQIVCSQSYDCVIDDCHSLDAGSHHYFGFNGSSGDTLRNTMRRCSGRRAYGLFTGTPDTAGSFYALSHYAGTNLNDCVFEDCDFRPGPVLKPDGTEVNKTVAKNYGVAAHSGPATGGTAARNIVRRTNFICRHGSGSAATSGLGATAVYSGLPAPTGWSATIPTSYPLLYQDCYIKAGGGLHSVPSGHTTQNEYVAYQRVLFDHMACGSRWNSSTANPSSDAWCWPYELAATTNDRYILFDRCTFLFNGDTVANAAAYNTLFRIGNGVTLRFRGCTFLMMGQNLNNNNQYVFTWVNSSATGVVIAENNIFAFPLAIVNDRQLCGNDSTWLANDSRRQFSGNFYIGVSKYSSNSSFDTGSEFCDPSTGADVTGMYYDPTVLASGAPLFEAPGLRADLATWSSKSVLRRSAVTSMASVTSGVVLTRLSGSLVGAGGDGAVIYPGGSASGLRSRFNH